MIIIIIDNYYYNNNNNNDKSHKKDIIKIHNNSNSNTDKAGKVFSSHQPVFQCWVFLIDCLELVEDSSEDHSPKENKKR